MHYPIQLKNLLSMSKFYISSNNVKPKKADRMIKKEMMCLK